MDGLTRDGVVQGAAVDPAFVDRLVELGILVGSPDGAYRPTDIRRVRIAASLEQAGLPLEAVAEALRRGDLTLDFVDEPAYDRFAGVTDVTFRELSVRTKVPLELILAVREATGSAQPDPDDHMRQDELDIVPALTMQLEQGVRPAVVERALRSNGESLRRLAEVESDWWRTDIIAPMMAAGATAGAVAPRTNEFANAYGTVADQMVLGLYHGNQAHSWMKNIFEGFEVTLAQLGLHNPAERPPAICFLDLSGYTRLTEERGDEAAADLAGRLARLVQRTSSQHGGKPVKWLGDGVMFHFREPGPGVVAALEMVDGARRAELPPAHVGLHAGPVLFQEGDYFGRTVNVAARIADYARQGEVLVSSEVVAASEAPGVTFDPIGPVDLKGLTETIELHVARRVAPGA